AGLRRRVAPAHRAALPPPQGPDRPPRPAPHPEAPPVRPRPGRRGEIPAAPRRIEALRVSVGVGDVAGDGARIMANMKAMSSPAGPPAWVASGRVPALDGLRAVSVLLILCAHAKPEQARGFAGVLVAIGRETKIGVDVFFVISGFLITLLLLRESDRAGSIALG